jgi:hypothetical protein
MKTKFLIGLFAIGLILSFGCSGELKVEGDIDELRDSAIYTEGYIVNYNRCVGLKERGEATAKARGYYIISENLQDTLLTYNLPDDLYEFPLAFFGYAPSDYDWIEGSPEPAFRYTYKIKFTYRLAKEEEKIIPVCDAFHYDLYHMAKQVIIDKIKKS